MENSKDFDDAITRMQSRLNEGKGVTLHFGVEISPNEITEIRRMYERCLRFPDGEGVAITKMWRDQEGLHIRMKRESTS